MADPNVLVTPPRQFELSQLPLHEQLSSCDVVYLPGDETTMHDVARQS